MEVSRDVLGLWDRTNERIIHAFNNSNAFVLAPVMDVYGDHLPHCKRGTHVTALYDEQVRLLVGNLSKAARHPVHEPHPLGRHRGRPDIRAFCRQEDLACLTLLSVIPALLRGSGPLSKTRSTSRKLHGRRSLQSMIAFRRHTVQRYT